MEANRNLLDQYVELYNAGDLDACMELYADDAVQLMATASSRAAATSSSASPET